MRSPGRASSGRVRWQYRQLYLPVNRALANHLAAAICNELLLRGKSVLIITVADIINGDERYLRQPGNERRTKLLNDLSMVDLLVIDEIGMQTESR